MGFWPWLFDDCYLNRDTEATLKRAGFAKVEAVSYVLHGASYYPFSTQIYGWATK